MAVLTEQKIAVTGTTITFAAAAGGGDSFVNTGYQKLRFINGSGAPITVTVDTPNPDNWGVVNNALDVTLTVPAGGQITAGPFDPARHNDANGRTQLTYSDVTSLTVAVTS
jgi:hypothetical protein